MLAKVIREEPPLPRKPTGRARRRDLQGTMDKARELAAAGQGPDSRAPCAGARRPLGAKTLFFFATPRHHASPAVSRDAGREDDESSSAPPALDPVGLGTLVHAVLADLAAGGDDSRPAIEAMVRKHAWRHLPESTDAAR